MTLAYIPATLRQQVYERAEGRCEYCLVPETVTLTAHQVDHIVALKHGGLTIVPLTPVGRATVRLLQFNQSERVAERELLIASGALHVSS
jgi:hypothetical protein